MASKISVTLPPERNVQVSTERFGMQIALKKYCVRITNESQGSLMITAIHGGPPLSEALSDALIQDIRNRGGEVTFS